MGIFRLYASIATYLLQHPDSLPAQHLDEIAAQYAPYAYIGSRALLESAVLKNAERLRGCEEIPKRDTAEDLAAWWFGKKDWKTNSGAFPDFVPASTNNRVVGDGAILELKDSQAEAIASFNSTLPSARKRLDGLTKLVRDAVSRFERCTGTRGSIERDCFYLVRTHKRCPTECRLSLVQGTFFETMPSSQLIAKLFGQLLEQAEVPSDLKDQVVEHLARLDRVMIAQTREIEGASIKPRLRIMSEIHAEGNPHSYPKIGARSVNLILKPPHERADFEEEMEWIANQCEADSVELIRTGQSLQLQLDASRVNVELKSITHRRNGRHLVLQTVV